MFLRGIAHALGLQRLQSADHAETGVARLDHVVDIAVAGCVVGVRELILVLLLALLDELGLLLGVGERSQLLGVQHLDSSACAHDGDLGR